MQNGSNGASRRRIQRRGFTAGERDAIGRFVAEGGVTRVRIGTEGVPWPISSHVVEEITQGWGGAFAGNYRRTRLSVG